MDKEINLPKMKELIKAWEKEYKRLEDIKQTDLEHLKFVKINAKALQLKYCIKALKKQLLIHSVVQQSELLLCKHCGNKKAQHSEATELCPDRFKHFEAK